MPTGLYPPRDRIVQAAAQLLAERGRAAVSTRSVSQAAGVQSPTIYRQFGDMEGLLDAVASRGFGEYLQAERALEHTADPVADMRRGWDLHVAFGVDHPALYALMYGDPRPGAAPTAVREAAGVLRQLVQRIADAGRLTMGVGRAAAIIHAAGCGVTLALISTEVDKRDPAISALTREAVLAALTTPAGQGAPGPDLGAATRAVALKAALPSVAEKFTAAERALLEEWLDRIAT